MHKIALVGLFLLLLAPISNAQTLTYYYQGTITSGNGTFSGKFGQEVSGSFFYDTSLTGSPVMDGIRYNGTIATIGFFLSTGGMNFSDVDSEWSGSNRLVKIDNNSLFIPEDSFILEVSKMVPHFQIYLSDSSEMAFSSNALPTTLDFNDFDDLGDVARGELSLNGLGGLIFNVTALSTTPVPLPPSLVLFAGVLPFIMRIRQRRRK